MPAQLYSLLYHSQLAPNAPISSVPDIIKIARSSNASLGVTGLLVFDGQRFVQQIEGPQQILMDLIVRIARDPRHVDFTLQHRGISAGDRLFGKWSMGYAHIEGGDPLAEGGHLRGEGAVKHFADLIPSFDIV